MADADVVYESTKKALNNFENIKECIQGIYEILKITLPSENTYFNMGQDNIEALYENFLELMINELGTVEFMKKLKSAELDLDLPLDNLL
jgi:agmatine/peptidylarginine deiminase